MTSSENRLAVAHWVVMGSLLATLSCLNMFLLVREVLLFRLQPADSEVRADFLVQRLVAFLPFCATALYCLVYEMSGRRQSVLRCFSDFYTFLGFPLSALHCVNILLHCLEDLFGVSSNYVVFPVVCDASLYSHCMRGESCVIVANFVALLLMLRAYKCLVTFKPFLPILMFSLLFGGVVLDRLALIDHSHVTSDDWQFIASLTVQILIVDVILILLSFLGQHSAPVERSEAKANDTKLLVPSDSMDEQAAPNSQNGNERGSQPETVRVKGDKFSLLRFITIDKQYHNLTNQM